ncbi:aspartate/glutamate racemase family protein [Loktanella sp. 5RATIMAR09]|uniref:aspartate/glutamate racemase family protein n=1 Tax=Loktanella sp. 5RATIMAR09 TaxID=1225655 RepID=UPI00257012A6|nr:aspartate/glutamate racemase family protein [Loktanella sp. 5RATIMAR09]
MERSLMKTIGILGGMSAASTQLYYKEPCKDITTKSSEATYIEIANRLATAGADCLILGCTEVGMLLNESNVSLPVFDTTRVHCAAALERALS